MTRQVETFMQLEKNKLSLALSLSLSLSLFLSLFVSTLQNEMT